MSKPALFPKRRLFDSHCHLNSIPGYAKRHVSEALGAGLAALVTVGTDIASSLQCLKLQQKFPGVVIAGAGIHPECLIPGSDLYEPKLEASSLFALIEELKQLLLKKDFPLIGECGMDFYWLQRNSKLTNSEVERSKALQFLLLKEQLKLARLFHKPVSLHSRAAEKECLDAVSAFAPHTEVIFHSYTGDLKTAAAILEQGHKIGINGIITYKSAEELRRTIKTLIGDKEIREPSDLYEAGFLLESDAPFLLPANSRLKEEYNSPKQVPFIWEFLYNYLNS